MSTQFVCDGCNTVASPEKPLEERGQLDTLHYCAKCVTKVDVFLARRDAIHEEIAEEFQNRLGAEMAQFAEDNPRMSLPDA